MSDNRKKYSSSPLYGMRHTRGGGYYVPPERPQRRRDGNTSVPLQIMMTLLLPILFIVALILGYRELHLAFLILSAIALIIMWAARIFLHQARSTLSLIYAAAMVVSLIAVIAFSKPFPRTEQQTTNKTGTDLSALFGRDTTPQDVRDYTNAQNPNAVATTAPTATPNSRSEAQQQLELFMNSWMSLDYDAMLSYCSPAWVNAQENPQHSIFKIRGTSTPVDFEVTAASGTEADDSRTLTMVASIDKGTGKAPQNYRYEVLMLRINGTWYVDPASLSSATEIKETSTPKPEYTIMPTYTPDMNMVLYYNPDGGSFYHASDQCTKVAQQYKPLKGSFLYSQLGEDRYRNLKPCDRCNPPGRND